VAYRYLQGKSFTLNVGDPILYGKYKNKKGVITGFKTGPKGDPIVVIEQVPNESGRKQPKELKLFKIRYDKARAEAMKKKGAVTLLPIFDPAYNFREVCKQLALLEDHLLHAPKRCLDCIRKHLLTAEALAEEAVSLDEDRKYDAIHQWLAEGIRLIWKVVHLAEPDYRGAARGARMIRKNLMPTAAVAKFGSVQRVADRYMEAGVFEAPPGLLEAFLRWALPKYAGNVLYHVDQRRQSLQDRTKPLQEAMATLQRYFNEVERAVKGLSKGEVAQWTLSVPVNGVLHPYKIGVKYAFTGIKGDPRYYTDASEKRLTFRKHRWARSQDDAIYWARQNIDHSGGRIESVLKGFQQSPEDEGPSLVEATLLVREASKYTSKAKAYKTSTKTTLPITAQTLKGWRYWDAAVAGMKAEHARLQEALIEEANRTEALYLWVMPHSVVAQALRYFGLDPLKDITPDEARKAAQQPFNEADVYKILKDKGWGEITTVLVFAGHKSRGGVWMELKRKLEVDVPYWGRAPDVATFQEGITEISRIARHEFQHVGQDLLKDLTGAKEELGLPSEAIRDPNRDPIGRRRDRPSGGRSEHALQDVEFYTRLADEIGRFVRGVRQIPPALRRKALRAWVGLSPNLTEEEGGLVTQIRTWPFHGRPFFTTLKRSQKGKWQKAVSEFVKGVEERGISIPGGLRMAFDGHPYRRKQRVMVGPYGDGTFKPGVVWSTASLRETLDDPVMVKIQGEGIEWVDPDSLMAEDEWAEAHPDVPFGGVA